MTSARRHGSKARRGSVWTVGAAAVLLCAAPTAFAATPTQHAAGSGARDGASAVNRGRLVLAGTSTPASVSSAGAAAGKNRIAPLLMPHRLGTAAARRATAAEAPAAVSTSVAGSRAKIVSNSDGVNAIQSRAVAGYNVEPPDEGLGAGNGYVVNLVNVAGAVYRTSGAMLTGPFFLNTFFKEPAATNLSDPRVFYDSSSHSWFASVLEYGFDAKGNFSESHVDLAVSATGDPRGAWRVFRIPASNTTHAGCPCLADYPIMGVDAYNVYLSTNEFTSDGTSFNGAQLYAVSKSQLVGGAAAPNYAKFENLSVAGTLAYHVQPANTYGSAPAEYMMSSLDPNNTFDNRLAVWAVTNRRAVTTGHGTPTLSVRVISSQAYSLPPDAQTPPGFCTSTTACGPTGSPTTGLVATDFDAMQEVQYINGQLVGALNTAVNIAGDSGPKAGVAWFAVHPAISNGQVATTTRVARQGYLATRGEYLTYPHINMTLNGAMTLVFGLGGPSTYLSAAYATAAPGAGFGGIRLAAAGTGPDNGFTGTKAFGGVARWGDYSNGQIIPGTNTVWLGTQYIPNTGTGVTNWGNRLFELNLG